VVTANREGATYSDSAYEKPADSCAMHMADAWSRAKGNAGGNDGISKGSLTNFNESLSG
jgi:hypothetical protein